VEPVLALDYSATCWKDCNLRAGFQLGLCPQRNGPAPRSHDSLGGTTPGDFIFQTKITRKKYSFFLISAIDARRVSVMAPARWPITPKQKAFQ